MIIINLFIYYHVLTFNFVNNKSAQNETIRKMTRV